MSASNVSSIIREVVEHTTPTAGREELITIDVRSGHAVSKSTFLDAFTGNYRYFLVSNNTDAEKVVRGTKRVRYKENGEEIHFTISFVGGCRVGQEWWLAQCFFKSSWDEAILGDRLAGALFDFFSVIPDGIDGFSQQKINAEANLATQAGQVFGLDLKITIELEDANELGFTTLGPLLVSSRLLDTDQADIVLSIDVEPDGTNLPRFLLSKNKPVDELIKKGLRDFAEKNISLAAYFSQLETLEITRLVTDHLNLSLKSSGRKVRYLLLKPGEEPPRSFKGETEIDYLHHDHPDPIKIRVSGLMIPINLVLYHNKNLPDLSGWWNQNVREVLDRVLFGVSYVDLLLEFAQYSGQINREMSLRTEMMGYSSQLLLTALFPNLEALVKGFELSITASENSSDRRNETMFDTSLSNFQVGLEVFLMVRVLDLHGVSKYLNSEPDIPTRMRQELLRVVRTFLHGTDPERFYMRFWQASSPPEKSVAEELTTKIQEVFARDFSAHILDIVFKPMQTELTKRLAALSRNFQDFNAGVELGSLPGAPTIFVKGTFRVAGVSPDGWKAFSDSNCEVESLKKRLETIVRARLRGEQIDRMLLEPGVIKGLVESALRDAQQLIKTEFGLVVNLTTIYWEWDEQLKQQRRQQNKQDMALVLQRIQKLKGLLLELHENDASPEHIRSVEARIKRLGATLPATFAASVGIQQNGNSAKTISQLSKQADTPD